MPKITNPVIISKIRKGLLEGKNDSDIMRDVGYSQSMIDHKDRKQIKSIQVEKSRIVLELKENDITPELILNRLNEDRVLARKKKDIATMTRCDELLGKYLAMFTEKRIIESHYILPTERTYRLTRLHALIVQKIDNPIQNNKLEQNSNKESKEKTMLPVGVSEDKKEP